MNLVIRVETYKRVSHPSVIPLVRRRHLDRDSWCGFTIPSGDLLHTSGQVRGQNKGGLAVGSLNRVARAMVAAPVVFFGLVACTSGNQQEPLNTDPQPRSSARTVPEPKPAFSLPDSLSAPTDVGSDETLLFDVDSQKEGATYGPVPTGAKTVVYLRCAGAGSVTFEMTDVGSFQMPCEQDGVAHGTRNLFDTRHTENPTFSVQSTPDQIWSIGTYSEPVP